MSTVTPEPENQPPPPPPTYQPPPAQGTTQPPPTYQPPPAQGTTQPPPWEQNNPNVTLVSSDEKNLSMIAVLGMILVGFIAPLVIYLMAGDDPSKQYSKSQAKEALNFSLTQLIGWVVTSILSLFLIGILLIPVMFAWLVWGIVVGFKAINEEAPAPKYPLTIQFLK